MNDTTKPGLFAFGVSRDALREIMRGGRGVVYAQRTIAPTGAGLARVWPAPAVETTKVAAGSQP